MRTIMLALAASAALASPAFAQVDESFDNEGNDNSVLNWPGNANLTVPAGTVDLVRSGEFDITCSGGSGSCIDLDGSTGNGGGVQTAGYTFSAGQLVTLSGLISGNQRNTGSDNFLFAFLFSSPVSGSNFTGSSPGGTGNFGTFSSSLLQNVQGTVGAGAAFGAYSISFRALTGGTVAGRISSFGTGTDNQGPILDNFSLSIAAVPEPGTWAMMILGFGLIGGALRTRKRAVLAVA